MQYKIIKANNTTTVSDTVNTQIKMGWELYGHPFVIPRKGDNMPHIAQAMIKKDENSEKTLLNS